MKQNSKQLEIPKSVSNRWWWRRLVFINFDEQTHTTQRKIFVPEDPRYGFSGEWHMWHDRDELFAFRFELLRRLYFPDLPEWHSLPGWLGPRVKGVLTPQAERPV